MSKYLRLAIIAIEYPNSLSIQKLYKLSAVFDGWYKALLMCCLGFNELT